MRWVINYIWSSSCFENVFFFKFSAAREIKLLNHKIQTLVEYFANHTNVAIKPVNRFVSRDFFRVILGTKPDGNTMCNSFLFSGWLKETQRVKRSLCLQKKSDSVPEQRKSPGGASGEQTLCPTKPHCCLWLPFTSSLFVYLEPVEPLKNTVHR